MKKTILKSMALATFSISFTFGIAAGIPTLPADYSRTYSEFRAITEITPGVNAQALFQARLEQASNESNTLYWGNFDQKFGSYYPSSSSNGVQTFAQTLNKYAINNDHTMTASFKGDKSAFMDQDDGVGNDADWDSTANFVKDVQSAPVPEPATMFLFGTGLICLGFAGKKWTKRS